MESLESRLERLSPGQRREVEDFVDFLLSRPESSLAGQPAAGTPPAPHTAPPLLSSI